MHSPCTKEITQACFYGFCPTPLLGDHEAQTSGSATSAAASRLDFEVAVASSMSPCSHFTNHESLPSLHESFSNFTKTFPLYSETDQADRIRAQEYYHLSLSKHVCLDYFGLGLFSYYQQQSHSQDTAMASTSSSPPPPVNSTALEPPFFDISYKSVDVNSQIQYGGQESELECKIKKRIMAFMNISEDYYTVVFTANQLSAFKILAESYPFQMNRNLLTVYDYENEAVEAMLASSRKKGARVMSAEFSWPTLKINSRKLLKKMVRKGKKSKRGLFVFPLLSRMTGARYSYLWMSLAQENGWHILLDACALGPKEMETLGLSLFKPDFLICSFFKVFGENPSGFGCLFVKKTSVSVLQDATTMTSIGVVNLVPAMKPSQLSELSLVSDTETGQHENPEARDDGSSQGTTSDLVSTQQMSAESLEQPETEVIKDKQKALEIEELGPSESTHQYKVPESGTIRCSELECRTLDHADSLGLILMNVRARCLINWLVNAFMSLKHPHSESGLPLVRIYGPKIKFDRGPVLAFNLFDWKGDKIDPAIVQKLADRNHISLGRGFLQHIWFLDKHEEERERTLEGTAGERDVGTGLRKRTDKLHSGISVVTASLGFLTNFEDIYRLWSFVSRFLDADFVEKERWRYTALNQKMVEI